ncbi:MAG: porin [Piscirickettsiaceae bacterium]|nr:porin [Piscirickettsiaceae bacterium]
MLFKRTILAASMLAVVSATQAATPSNEEIWQLLQQMQQQMTEVQQQNQQLKAENENLKDKVEATEQMALETSEAVEAVAVATEEAVKNVSLIGDKTTIGGYGELHYNNLNDQHGSADKDEVDFHRFVLFFGHEFTDNLRFFSELELEHSLSGNGKEGEVELEQAYIEYDINDQHRVTGGLFLTPVGIINETHEPNTFYGTERNPIEKNIIPATWWEAGVMFSGEIAEGFSYDVAATSGLSSKNSDYKIRDGRQKVSKANAENFAYTGRIKWTGIPGVELAATVNYQEDFGQENVNDFKGDAGSATLFETHAVIQRGAFGLRALYATWDLDGDGPKSNGADEQTGWYIEPSFQISNNFGIFARYNEWDNQAGNSSDSEYQQIDLGVNWWPHKDVVVKIDYQDQDAPAGKAELDGFNVGLGYQF